MINLLLNGSTCNKSGHFAYCSCFSFSLWGSEKKVTMQLAKYPRALYVKPLNMVYEMSKRRLRIMQIRKSTEAHHETTVSFCFLL